ncbi:MAG: glycosyltransferase family 2 protein [Gammaproteobacteria bacterium]|nr:glycosyltransferase family 2 protein [Gammaproteobacteria bacterium]MBI5616677.1 glycosyltransferase family 2 protein [Gammaproteobacteria bacterium]
MSKTISVCIPVYNESENIVTAVARVEELFRSELPDYGLELVVTDNASSDDTWDVIKGLAQSRPDMKALRFSRNFGYQNSIFAALSTASGDAVVELDADLEDPPEVIPRFVEKWREGYDVVYGVRSKRYGSLIIRAFTLIFYRLLNMMSEQDIPRDSGDFRLLDRKVVAALVAMPERNLYLRGLVAFLGFRQTPVVYERHPRLSGASKFRFFHYVILAIDAFTAFTKFPLRLIGVLGFLLFSGALVLAAYYLGLHFVGGIPVQGFTTLVILMLILHGITFIFLGILGEYLSRIFDDSKMRPRVVIAETIHVEKPPEFL